MLQIDKRIIKNFDLHLLSILSALLLIGWIAVYSASYDPGSGKFNSYYIKQAYWILIGFSLFIFFSVINYKNMIKYILIFYIVGIITLSIVLVIGHVGMGAQRWINIGGFKFQPSEFFKIIIVVVMTKIYSDFHIPKLKLLDIFRKMPLLIIPFILVFLQPDLGTALVFIAVWGIMLLFRGVDRFTLILSITVFILAMPFAWSQLRDYQKNRIVTFINPEHDPFGAGYHIIQSKIAIGSGGILGKGFLKGTQSHLNFLPERHTDFIFSLINEEFGILGGTIIIFLFMSLIIRILYISWKTKEVSGKLLCAATASILFFQFFVNAAMTVGLMPVVGIPMPFISYGGSAMLTFMSLLGMVNSVSIRKYNSPGEF